MKNLKQDDIDLIDGKLKSIRQQCKRVAEILTERGYVTFWGGSISVTDVCEVISSEDWTSTEEMFSMLNLQLGEKE